MMSLQFEFLNEFCLRKSNIVPYTNESEKYIDNFLNSVSNSFVNTLPN